jgi:hypothetical protein
MGVEMVLGEMRLVLPAGGSPSRAATLDGHRWLGEPASTAAGGQAKPAGEPPGPGSLTGPMEKPRPGGSLAVRVGLLGSVRVWVGVEEVDPGPARQCAVLALLAANAGRPVSDWSILDGVWGDAPPDSGIGVVQQYVSRLRRVIGRQAIVRRPAGYCLTAPGLSVDLIEFERWLDQARLARRAGDLDRAEDRYAAALALWRGEPLAGVPGPAAERRRRGWRRRGWRRWRSWPRCGWPGDSRRRWWPS